MHKQSFAIQALADLTILRNQLRSLALDRDKAVIAKCRRMFYKQSTKCGKLVAWALKAQQAHLFVLGLLTDNHTKVHTTEEIASLFQRYYTKLYILPHLTLEREKSIECKAIQDYLQRLGLPQLSKEDLTELGKPVSADEVALAMA